MQVNRGECKIATTSKNTTKTTSKRRHTANDNEITKFFAIIGAREVVNYLDSCHNGKGEDNRWYDSFFSRIEENLELNPATVDRILKKGRALGLIEQRYLEGRNYGGRTFFRGYALTNKGHRAKDLIEKLEAL